MGDISPYGVQRLLAQLSRWLRRATRPVSAEEEQAALRDPATATPGERERADAAAQEVMQRIRRTPTGDGDGQERSVGPERS